MKKTLCILLMILFLCGCAATNSANSVNSATQSQQSKIRSSLPAISESAAVKDDAYYENLIKDIKYPEIYHVKSDASLMDVIGFFIYDFDLIFSNTEFSSPQELGDEIILPVYYITTSFQKVRKSKIQLMRITFSFINKKPSKNMRITFSIIKSIAPKSTADQKKNKAFIEWRDLAAVVRIRYVI